VAITLSTPTTAITTKPSTVSGCGGRTASPLCWPNGPLIVSGDAQSGCVLSLFDHIVLLSAPSEVLVERLGTRTTNPYGKDPAQIAETLEYLDTVEPLLREAATLEVVTTLPVARVADVVLAHCL
jgi:hypothetical protein